MPISSEAHNYINNKAHTCAYRQTHVNKDTLYSEASQLNTLKTVKWEVKKCSGRFKSKKFNY